MSEQCPWRWDCPAETFCRDYRFRKMLVLKSNSWAAVKPFLTTVQSFHSILQIGKQLSTLIFTMPVTQTCAVTRPIASHSVPLCQGPIQRPKLLHQRHKHTRISKTRRPLLQKTTLQRQTRSLFQVLFGQNPGDVLGSNPNSSHPKTDCLAVPPPHTHTHRLPFRI